MTLRTMCARRAAGWILAALGLLGTLASAANLQPLPGHVLAAVRDLSPLGRVEAGRQLNVAICLPLRQTNELEQLLQQICDPSSPQFRHYLSAEEFARRFAPSEEDYARLSAFCRSNGLSVSATHPNRTILDVTGPAEAVERAFHTRLSVYAHPTEARNFFAPETEPSMDLAVPVLRVHGLDDYSLPRALHAHRKVLPGQVDPASGSGSSGSYLGSDFRQAYAPGVSRTGAGQTLALVEFDAYYASDISAYATLANMTAVPLTNILIDGFKGTPSSSGNEEVALDIEVAMAMAPGLNKIMVYETSSSGSAYDVLNRIATDNAAKQISCSWLAGTFDSSADQIFKQYAAQGQSFFQAAGDNGYYSGSVNAPADDPYITIVGGTTLSTSGGAWSGEVVWNDGSGDATGGGYSTTYALPSWQNGVSMASNGGSTFHRNLPDVAMIADNVMTVSDKGKHNVLMGTSIAAPLWAAFTALVNEQAASAGLPNVGFLNPALYGIGKSSSYLNAFHDVTDGDNGVGRAAGFSAVPGYDLCTGWGSPQGSNTLNQLLEWSGGGIDHFAWSPVGSPVVLAAPFSVTLKAETISNALAPSFTGSAALSAAEFQTNVLFQRDFESGDLSDWRNSRSRYTNKIDTATGAAGSEQSLSIFGGDGTNSYNDLSYSLNNINPDWVVFYVKALSNTNACCYFVAGSAAYRSNSVFHFRMDETQSMGLTDGAGNFYAAPYSGGQWYKVSLHLDWIAKLVDYYVNGQAVASSVPFCNTNLTGLAVMNLYNFDVGSHAWYDQISFLKVSSSSVAISPASVGPFVSGSWSGSVSVLNGGTNIYLTASDSDGHTGISNPFSTENSGTNTGSTTNTGSGTNNVLVTVLASPAAGGSVNGGGSFPAGSVQSLTATPKAGWSFSRWQDNSSENPRTIVVPDNDIAYTAFFITNPPPQFKGAFSGLFFQSNDVVQSSSGSFSLSVTAKGAFSGSLQTGSTRRSLSGKFDTSGYAMLTNGPRTTNPVYVALQMDVTQGTDRMAGAVSNASWASQLAADRAVFNAKTNQAPQAGRYTLVLPGADNSSEEPGGASFGTLTIGTAGQVNLAVSLADGTKASQSSALSKYGQWPLYLSLYSGKGSVLSWMTVTNAPSHVLGGQLVWIKPSSASAKYYPKGFQAQPFAFGAFYQAPTGTNKVLDLTTAQIVLNSGGLTNSMVGQFALGAKSRVTTTNKLSLSFAPSSGLFSGSLKTADHPKAIIFTGVVMQNQTNGIGYFLGTNQSGSVRLTP